MFRLAGLSAFGLAVLGIWPPLAIGMVLVGVYGRQLAREYGGAEAVVVR